MPVNVCHISTMTRWGGVERMLVDLLENVVQTDVQHFLLTTSSQVHVLDSISSLPIQHFEPRRSWQYDARAILQMANWLTEKKIDVVHAYNAYANSWGYLASRYSRTRFIASEHGTVLSVRPPIKLLDQWSQNHAELVIANSQASKMILQTYYGLTAEKIRVVLNGIPSFPLVDTQAIRHEFGWHDKFIVGSIGRLDTPKNFTTLVEVAELLCPLYEDMHFVVVGGGPLEAELKYKIQQKGLEKQFQFLGWRKDARQILQTFDLFACTSIQESFGNTLVEAALAGKPVIAPRVGGIPEIVIQNETGILLTPSVAVTSSTLAKASPLHQYAFVNGELRPPLALQVDELAEAITYLYMNPALCLKYGYSARKRAIDLFSIERYCKQLELIYQEVSR